MVDFITQLAIAVSGVAVAMVVGFFLFMRSFPYRIRLRELTSTNVRLIHDKLARIAKDDEKVEYLRLFGSIGNLKQLPLPPPDAIDYDPKKKKKIIEAWYSDDQGITYITDKGEKEGFQPFTTKQRAMMVNQVYKKEARRVRNWTENIPLIVGVGSLVLIITVLLLFWGEAVAPIQDAAGTAITAIEKADQLWGTIDAATTDKQIIREEPPP